MPTAAVPRKNVIRTKNVSSVGRNFFAQPKSCSLTVNAIENFQTFGDHMSCNADRYVSLGVSNDCADQLMNWDGTQEIGLLVASKTKNAKSIKMKT